MYNNLICIYPIYLVERYNYIVNGEAEHEIKEFIAAEHTFEEYTEVCMYYTRYIYVTYFIPYYYYTTLNLRYPYHTYYMKAYNGGVQ